jgi:hypothetical protein
MYQLQYDPGLTAYEIERRMAAAGRSPADQRRTSQQVITDALRREDLWRLVRRATSRAGR